MNPTIKQTLGAFRFPTKKPVVPTPYPAPFPPISPTWWPAQTSVPVKAR